MRHVMSQRIVRCAALNPSNLRGNDVLGTATGGVEHLVCSVQDKIYFFDLPVCSVHTKTHNGPKSPRRISTPLKRLAKCTIYSQKSLWMLCVCGGI